MFAFFARTNGSAERSREGSESKRETTPQDKIVLQTERTAVLLLGGMPGVVRHFV